jgi:chromosome segregation ATPase
MTNIFSSKKEISELKADNEKLQASLSETEKQVETAKGVSQEFAAFKETFSKEKTEWNTAIETMKAEFNAAVEALKHQLADMTKAKAEVETKAKVEVEKAKEISKEEVKAQVMEGVALKVASIGISESELPKVSQSEIAETIKIVRY